MTALVHFYKRAVPNAYLSNLRGCQVFDDADYVTIQFPGQDKDIADRAVKPEDKTTYSSQWDKYQRGLEQVQDGTPLESWPQLSPSELAMLKSLGVHTIEAVRDLNDGQLQNVMGGRNMQRRAKAYLEQLAPVSRSAALLSDATALVESAVKIADSANETGINTEDQAQNAATLLSVVNEQGNSVKMAMEHISEHYTAEIGRLSETMEQLTLALGESLERLSGATAEIEGKMKMWRVEREKGSAARGETLAAAPVTDPVTEEAPEPDPNKPEIVGSAGSDPTEGSQFFEGAQA